jgi:hypothetical protein
MINACDGQHGSLIGCWAARGGLLLVQLTPTGRRRHFSDRWTTPTAGGADRSLARYLSADARPRCVARAHCHGNWVGTTGFGQRVASQGKILVSGRNAGIVDQHRFRRISPASDDRSRAPFTVMGHRRPVGVAEPFIDCARRSSVQTTVCRRCPLIRGRHCTE